MPVDIRRLTSADAEAWWNLRLVALETERFSFSKSAEEHRATTVETTARHFREAPATDFTLGAFDADRLIGMATFKRDLPLKERHKGHLFGVYVDPAYRGRGVGKAILTRLIETASQDQSLEQILLIVSNQQIAAKALYRSLGFVTFGTEPNALKVGDEYSTDDHMILRLR